MPDLGTAETRTAIEAAARAFSRLAGQDGEGTAILLRAWYQSGISREGSKYGIEKYREIKYVCMGGI